MLIKRAFSLLAMISLLGLFACDFFPGSSYNMRQSVRTWSVLDAQSEPDCILVGTYTLRQDLNVPDFNVSSNLRFRTENREDQEFLPSRASLQWDLNDSFFYQIDYDLDRRGRGRGRLRNQEGWSLNADDVLDTWLCIPNGIIPMHTRVDYRMNWRFHRQEYQNEER